MVEYGMEMRWHLFANPDYMEHVEKIRAAKLAGESPYIPYEPNLDKYFHAGDIVFDISEGLRYLAFPESLMDCMFAVGIFDYENRDYAKVFFDRLGDVKKTAMYPTDILILDNIAMIYGTGTMEDAMGCPIPFQTFSGDVKILLDKMKFIV